MDNMYEHFLANTIHAGYQNKICPVRMDSVQGAKFLSDGGHAFDMIYIDGARVAGSGEGRPPQLPADDQAWRPLLRRRLVPRGRAGRRAGCRHRTCQATGLRRDRLRQFLVVPLSRPKHDLSPRQTVRIKFDSQHTGVCSANIFTR